jgi:hypothetical protein
MTQIKQMFAKTIRVNQSKVPVPRAILKILIQNE